MIDPLDRERTQSAEPRLFGVLVTFRRPEWLAAMLERLRQQTHQLHHLVVVDNAPAEENVRLVHAHNSLGCSAEYIPAPSNLGPAGGLSLGTREVLQRAEEQDWVVYLDDDNLPATPILLETLLTFGRDLRRADARVAAVGSCGNRFDGRRGRKVRPRDDELAGPVPVHSIGGGLFPLYAVPAIRDVGGPDERLFFGCEELELGLRLTKTGYLMYSHGELHLQGRTRAGRLNTEVVPRRALVEPPKWRQYYSLRNLVWMLREHGCWPGAVRTALIVGILKPLANMPRHPVLALQHLKLNVLAITHAYRSRLGLTVPPEVKVIPNVAAG